MDKPLNLGPLGILRLEGGGAPGKTREVLMAKGWPMGASDGGFGRYECIENRKDGNGNHVYAVAREMRADGCALAY